MKKLIVILFAGLLLSIVAFPAIASENSALGNLQKTEIGEATGITADLPAAIGGIIKTILGVMGLLMVIYIIYGGYLWLTSGGEDEKAKKGSAVIKQAIIGIIIISAAYTITAYVISKIQNPAGNGDILPENATEDAD